MTFASLEIRYDPPQWSQFPEYLSAWLQDAGLIAAFALGIWLLAHIIQSLNNNKSPIGSFNVSSLAVIGGSIGAAVCYALFLALLLSNGRVLNPLRGPSNPTEPDFIFTPNQQMFLAVGGLFAILAVTIPMLAQLSGRITFRRIWAIARLSIQETIRRRYVFVFAIMAVVFLFAGWFVPYKPEEQIKTYVTVMYVAMTPLFLGSAALFGAFSIPTDVVKQTIHTIVTKPVERYEIVLGRFMGFGLLLTVALFGMTAVSLVYVTRGIEERAAEESFKARVPVFGTQLKFFEENRGFYDQAESVGREDEYRTYIRGRTPGSNEKTQYAVFDFAAVPGYLAQREGGVPIEYTFDIFRTTKGEEGRDVLCTFTFADGALDPLEIEERVKMAEGELNLKRVELDKQFQEARNKAASTEAVEKIDAARQQRLDDLRTELTKKYSVFRASGVPVVDYHTMGIDVPPVLFEAIGERQTKDAGKNTQPPALRVLVNVEDDVTSRAQRVGVAKRDLYILAAELPFWQNYLKGVFGLWCNTMLVLGVAVACSTYLNGIISLLCSLFLLFMGLFVEYGKTLAVGKSVGGGPIEAANRLMTQKPLSVKLDPSAAVNLSQGVDSGFSWLLQFVLKMIPDANRFSLTEFVANGFDISWTQIILLNNFLPLLAYLIPWGILAYYLMNSREIANPM